MRLRSADALCPCAGLGDTVTAWAYRAAAESPPAPATAAVAGIEPAAEWARPDRVVRCGINSSLPMSTAIPHTLTSILWRAKHLLPPREYEAVCDELTQYWDRNAAAVSAATSAHMGSAWQGAAAVPSRGGGETSMSLFAHVLEAFGGIMHGFADSMRSARAACRDADVGPVRSPHLSLHIGLRAVVQSAQPQTLTTLGNAMCLRRAMLIGRGPRSVTTPCAVIPRHLLLQPIPVQQLNSSCPTWPPFVLCRRPLHLTSAAAKAARRRLRQQPAPRSRRCSAG